MLQHADSSSFQKHYLARELNVDPMAIIRRQEPQRDLVRISGSIGSSISKRRPVDLTLEQSASVNGDPLIERLAEEREKLRREAKRSRDTLEKFQEVTKKLRKEKARLRRELLQKIRDEWRDKQAVIDIKRQLAGLGFEVVAAESPDRHQGPAQKRLVDALTTPGKDAAHDYVARRNAAIAAVAAYCAVEEGSSVRRARPAPGQVAPRKDPQPAAPTARAPEPSTPAAGRCLPTDDEMYSAVSSVFPGSRTERPKRCFLCVGKACTLPRGDRRIGELTRPLYSPGDVSMHFRRKHLDRLRPGDAIWCDACKIALDHKMHLQNHAATVHSTLS